jgi:hypothetical protein
MGIMFRCIKCGISMYQIRVSKSESLGRPNSEKRFIKMQMTPSGSGRPVSGGQIDVENENVYVSETQQPHSHCFRAVVHVRKPVFLEHNKKLAQLKTTLSFYGRRCDDTTQQFSGE